MMVAKSAFKTTATNIRSYSPQSTMDHDNASLTQAKEKAAPPTAAAAASSTTINNDNTTSATTTAAPPPLTFIEIDPNERLPVPPPPSNKELLKQAEELVYWAISSKHENSPANQLASSSTPNSNNTTTTNNGRNKAIEAARRHSLLTDLLSRKSNPQQLLYTLHALTTSNSGRDLDKLVTHPKLHAQLIHLLLRMDPFSPGVEGGNGLRELNGIWRVDRAAAVKNEKEEQQQQLQQQQQQSNHSDKDGEKTTESTSTTSIIKKSNKPKQVKIDPTAINHKHQIKYIIPTTPFLHYHIADTYCHLLITLISTNSILSVSAVRAIWNLLTDFGSRWTEGEGRRLEERRKWRRRRRVLERRRKELEKQQKKIEEEESGGDLPLVKRQRLNDEIVVVSSSSTPSSTPAASVEKLTELNNKNNNNEEEEDNNNDVFIEEPEGERIVPGMCGLTVDFVRDVFFSKTKQQHDTTTTTPTPTLANKEEEIIHSNRLPSGRVHRLLLTLLNIFRLCPRSKSDLLREISNNFPHYKTCPPALYQWYSHVCLQLLHLVPTMEGPIMSMFVDKALDMDVEIKIDDKGGVFLDNGSGNNGDDEGDFFNGTHPEDDVVATTTTSPMPKKRSFQQLSSPGITTPNSASNSAALDTTTADDESDHINEIAERLDTLMTVLYEHIIQATAFSPDSLSEAMMAAVNARRMYRHLDEVFDKKVRTTDRSKFVQFVFFVLFGRENDALEAVGRLMATKREQINEIKNDVALDNGDLLNQMDPLYRGFSAKLIDVFFNPSYAGDVPRQTVVCYLASFVSRATYVCPETVCECIAALLRWAEIYVTAQESQKQKGRVPLRRSASSTLSLSAQQNPGEVHALFYTSCQAAFYLMCFRGVEAIQYYRNAYEHRDDPDSPYADPESVDIGPQRWRFLCGHEMQPLKYCLESVRLEFLHLAEDLDLFLDPGLDDELPNIEETKAFLDGLWNSFSKEGKKHAASKTEGKKTPARRRSTIISTAAIQEKKRLDGGVGGLGKGSNPLGSFFPFDPYLLQKSYQHVHPYYRNWEDCIPSSSLDASIDIDVGEEVDVNADMSDIEDDIDNDQIEDEEDDSEEEDEDDDDEEDDQSKDSNAHVNTKPVATNDESFEMEFRRSRAMSTGSQMSW